MIKPILGATWTAVLIVASQAPVGVWWIGPVSLVPWLMTSRTLNSLVFTGLLWGTLSGVGMGHWIAKGLVNVGATPAQGILGTVGCALVITGVPAAIYGLVATVARLTPRASWLAFALGVAIVDIARGSEWFLPWSLHGHSQSNAHGVAQLAVAGGVPLVSAFLGAIAFATAESLRRRVLDRALLPLAASYACLLVLGVPVAEFVRESRPARASDRSILILQPRLPAGDRWIPDLQQTNVALLSRRTLSALTSAGERPDLIVWPETSITVDLRQVPDVKDELDRWLALLDTDLLLGGVTSAGETERYRNTAIWVSPAGTVLDQVDKTRAVPFVERAPTTRIEGWLRTLMGAGSIDRLVREGTEQRPLRSTNAYAVAFCYEVLYPQLVAARTDDDVLAILNLANDAWYGSATPGQQQLAFATFRAIEQRRHVIRVADSGPSGVVDSYGRIVSRLPPSEMGTLFARITPSVPPLARERVAIPALALCGGLIGLLAARLASHPWRRTRAPAPRT